MLHSLCILIANFVFLKSKERAQFFFVQWQLSFYNIFGWFLIVENIAFYQVLFDLFLN